MKNKLKKTGEFIKEQYLEPVPMCVIRSILTMWIVTSVRLIISKVKEMYT